MFKKTLAGAAVLTLFAGSAFAANVTMYGNIDTGLQYLSVDDGQKTTHSFSMVDGTNTASRWGLKGVEDLGNGYKVGFSLESGFNGDDGTLGYSGRLFGREAIVWVSGPYGEIGMGRQGELASGNGRYMMFGPQVNPMSTSWGEIAGYRCVLGGTYARLDNALTYRTPTFAGVTVYAQYSVKNDNKSSVYGEERENSNAVERTAALGVNYKSSDLYLAAVVSSTKLDSETTKTKDDPLTINVGGNVNFGSFTLYGALNVFCNASANFKPAQYLTQTSTSFDGYGATVGVMIPMVGGRFKTFVGYMNAEDQLNAGDKAQDMQRYAYAVGYEYPFSKRTMAYAGAGYFYDAYDLKVENYSNHGSTLAVAAGLVHKF